jgi:hypothetical protein
LWHRCEGDNRTANPTETWRGEPGNEISKWIIATTVLRGKFIAVMSTLKRRAFSGHTGDWIQGLVFARQVIYHLSHTCPFAFGLFFR